MSSALISGSDWANRDDSGSRMPVAVTLHPTYRVPESDLWQSLEARTRAPMSPIVADLLDLARLLFAADCQIVRPKSWARCMDMRIAVREPQSWQRSDVKTALLKLLHFLSGDEWDVGFESGKLSSPPQQIFMFPFDSPFEVCLMSEGVDSLSGLAGRLDSSSETEFLAVSALTQYQVYSRLRSTIRQLNLQHGSRVQHVPVPLYRSNNRERPREETSQRTRTFLLLAIGAAVAIMTGRESFEVYESGTEMFNDPLSSLLLPTFRSRAMHPRALALMAEFIAKLLDAPFAIRAPFALCTKGEVVAAARRSLSSEMILRTVSCVHFPQRRSGPRQCGVCSGCILRRVALHSAGIAESTGRYQVDIVSGSLLTGGESHGTVDWDDLHRADLGAYRLKQSLANGSPERALMKLTGLPYADQQELLRSASVVCGVDCDEVLPALIRLYQQYVLEWEDFRSHVSVLHSYNSHMCSPDQEVCFV